jgi:hypothetical protein
LRAALAVRALVDTLPPGASDDDRATHEERRLYGALLVAMALGDLAMIRSVFFRFRDE